MRPPPEAGHRGGWAEGLGLSGVVEADELRALVEGKHPVSGEDLLAGSRPRKVRAFDLTFSSPKSVSLLWAFASEPVAEQVAAAHRDAVEAALGFLEERAAVAMRALVVSWVVSAGVGSGMDIQCIGRCYTVYREYWREAGGVWVA